MHLWLHSCLKSTWSIREAWMVLKSCWDANPNQSQAPGCLHTYVCQMCRGPDLQEEKSLRGLGKWGARTNYMMGWTVTLHLFVCSLLGEVVMMCSSPEPSESMQSTWTEASSNKNNAKGNRWAACSAWFSSKLVPQQNKMSFFCCLLGPFSVHGVSSAEMLLSQWHTDPVYPQVLFMWGGEKHRLCVLVTVLFDRGDYVWAFVQAILAERGVLKNVKYMEQDFVNHGSGLPGIPLRFCRLFIVSWKSCAQLFGHCTPHTGLFLPSIKVFLCF